MKIKVTGVSVSKKGTVWLQAKTLDDAIPQTDTTFNCITEEGGKMQLQLALENVDCHTPDQNLVIFANALGIKL